MRLPKDLQFATREVFIRKEGEDVILSPRPEDWGDFFTAGPVASPEYMEGVERLPVREVCMSVVTRADLLYGVRVSPHGTRGGRALRGLLTYVEVMDFPEGAAEDDAEIRADLKARGRLIGANDLSIAAHARSLGLTLVTNNTAEFSRVKGLAPLALLQLRGDRQARLAEPGHHLATERIPGRLRQPTRPLRPGCRDHGRPPGGVGGLRAGGGGVGGVGG